jgi:transposase
VTDPRDQRIAELESRVAAQAAQLASKDAEIAELKRKVEELTQLVLMLKERLDRNSGNSGKPPSSDSPGQRAERRGRPTGGKRGGQPGHAGSKRDLLPREQVDEFKPLFPSQCGNCFSSLPQTSDAVQRYQTVDLPVLKAHVIEWLRHRVACPKCRHQTWASTAQIPATPFGPRVEAVIGLVTGVYHLSRRVAVSFMSDILGIDISLGAVSAVEERVSEATKAPVKEAWAKTEAAATKHTDGTTWYQSGVLCALWTIATSAVTVFRILSDGKATTLAPLFGSKLGILVSDRATALNFWAMDRRQVCWAHLLRKAISFSERAGPSATIGRELLAYITIIFEYWHALKDGRLTRDEFRVLMAPVRVHVEALLARAAKSRHPHVSGSCEDILNHRAALWTFVESEGVEPTNNHAERELRAFVLWRKRSFGTQSARGNQYAERLMTVAHTARKQKKNVLEFLTACCAAARTGATPPSLFAAA